MAGVRKVQRSGFIDAISRKLRVISNPYYQEIAEGSIPDHFPFHGLGKRSPGTLTKEDLSELAAATIPIPTVATAMEVVSTSASDVAAGTGVQTVMVHGLDANYNELEETITMNGVTPVATVNSYLRVQLLHAQTAGTGGSPAGTVSLQSVGGGTIYAQMFVGETQSIQALFTVPASHKGFLTSWTAGTDAKETLFQIEATRHPIDGDLTTLWFPLDFIIVKDSLREIELNLPYDLPSKCDLKITVTALNTIGGNAAGSFELYYEKED